MILPRIGILPRMGSAVSVLMLLAVAGCYNAQKAIESSSTDAPAVTVDPAAAAPFESDLTAAGESVATDTSPVQIRNADPVEQRNAESPVDQQPELGMSNRSYSTIQAIESDNPNELISHLREIDIAIGDLVIAGSSSIVEKQKFVDLGIRLGRMKYAAGEQLASQPNANAEQKKTGTVAQLVALSHMSGIGNVEAAQQLESFARELSTSSDPDLVHQSRIVLLGFALQALQNGVESDPQELMSHVNGLFEQIEDRDFPELMMLEQAYYVLQQMGFNEASDEVSKIVVSEYLDVADPQLRGEAWSFATRDSQALANFNNAGIGLGTEQFDSHSFVAAARGLYEAFPTATALEHLAKSVANLEYGGFVDLSGQLAGFVEGKVTLFPDSFSGGITRKLLADHNARLSLLGRPLELTQVVGFDDAPIDWSAYEGKTVLIEFWATWCKQCRQESPNILDAYDSFSKEGFEVIGINMDDDLEIARQFVFQKKYPWRNFYFQDQLGFRSEFAEQNGVTMIPFMVLVGPDGNVAKIHPRGVLLAPAVRSLLGLDTSLIPDAN